MTGKFRHRTGGKSKNHIPKGQLCESNPTRNKYRAAAMAARNASLMGSMVAVDDRTDSLPDILLDSLPINSMSLGCPDLSSKSMVSEGGLSKISAFTSCTNPAFDAVHRVWKSGSSMQTEVVSVLAAVAELIKERNGTESDVEYFAALLTTLESSPLSEPSRTAATAYLLNLIVKKVSREILQSQFTKATQIIYTKMLENAEKTDGAVLKNLLSVLGVILRAQPAVVWQAANIRNMLVSVTSMCTHDKAWVRTMARRVVRAVLTDPVTATENGLHAASSGIGQFIIQQLESTSKNNAVHTVRYLCLLEGIMHKMPSNLFRQLSEAILQSLAYADSMVKCSALQCMLRALQRQPCDAALPVETNVLIVNALRSLAPPSDDIAVCAYWMQALSEAHVCLTAKDPARSYQLLDPTLKMMVVLFDKSNEQLAQVTYQVLSRIIERCVQDNEDMAKNLLGMLDEALTLRSAPVWKFILRTEMRLFETAGEGIAGPQLTKALESLAQLRQSDHCFCKPELDFTIGSVVRHVGTRPVLDALPLMIDPSAAVLATDFPRSWLLPILRVNIHNAPLLLFWSFFLPLATKIHSRLNGLDALTCRLYTTLEMQLWELLPSFCESPSDLEKSFPDIAPVLGAAITERKDLRLTVLTAIRRALKFALQPDAPPERAEVMSRFAKNFMPLLFNLYVNPAVEGEYDDKGVRLAVLETVRCYVEATPSDLLSRFVDSAISKANEEGKGLAHSQKQARVLDILCALSKTADRRSLEKILDTINPWYSSNDIVGLQKKAYRILEEILTRQASSDLEDLFNNRSDDIENAILRPLATITTSARAALCGCTMQVVDNISDFSKLNKLCIDALPAIVLSLDKANSTHARANASKCLQHMCSRLIELGAETGESPSTVLHPILSHIYEMVTPTSGNIGEVDMTTGRACLVALNIIAQKQMKILNASHLSRLVSHGCSWIGDGRAPVRILAIRLLRVVAQKMPDYAMHQYRDLLLTSIFDGQLTSDLTVKVRKANRLLLEVLVEKFGVPVLEKYTNKPDWVKQLKNIEKIKRRKERNAGTGEDEEKAESDDDGMSGIGSKLSARTAGADTILELLEDSDASDNDSEAEVEIRSKAGTGSVWLRDDQDGEATDLLDRTDMISKVTTADPALQARRRSKMMEKSKESGFKFTKDGKMIIEDDEEDRVGFVGRKRKNGLDELDGKDEKRTRKDSDASDDDDNDDDDESKVGKTKSISKSTVSKTSGWRPGGIGIHRDTTKDGKKQQLNGDHKKKGQKVQPYAYVPLRQKGKQDIRKVLKAQRKSGKKNFQKNATKS